MAKQGEIIITSVIAAVLVAIALVFIFVILPFLNKGTNQINTFDITNIEIQLNGKDVGDSIEKEFTADDFTFSVVINSNEDNSGKDKPEIKWSIISENDLNCKIDDDGKFTIGDTLGSLKVQVSVTSKNTLSKSVIYGNRALNTAGLEGGQRPDILAQRYDGTWELYEFASPSQASGANLTALQDKINLMIQNNPGKIVNGPDALFKWGQYP